MAAIPAGAATTRADIAVYTAKALVDPRTRNKRLTIAPPSNLASQQDLVRIWMEVSGQQIETTYMTSQELERQIDGARLRLTLLLHF